MVVSRDSQSIEHRTFRDIASLVPSGDVLVLNRTKVFRARLLGTRDSGAPAELLLLKYTENWNYHQLAERLGVSHSAVEARLHRARARLRGELAALEVTIG